MAADLHDELGPLLSVIKMRINSIDVTDEDDREQQELSSRQIDEVLERLRGIARNLMPNTLVRKGLVKAVEEFTNAFNQTNHLKVHFESNLNQDIDEERSINIFRVIQEICQNALKHSKASQLLIRLNETKKGIQVLCEDNGVGFDYEKMLKEGKGLGLRNLKSRVEIMGGQFMIESRPGKGTQYVFDVPNAPA
ncbi:MAG TPA: ATP-binding protein [Flavisolibacter sp.]|nr:ATP-binding protein [Flavisolibacter sp.]